HDRWFERAHAGIAGEYLLVAGNRGARLLRRLGVRGEPHADLAAAGERAQRAALPAGHARAAFGVKAGQLERPAVRLLERRERQAELHALRRAPLRLAVDRDHRGFAPGALFGPYHFEAALRIVRKQNGAGNLAAFRAVHLAEREVARVVFDRELEVR